MAIVRLEAHGAPAEDVRAVLHGRRLVRIEDLFLQHGGGFAVLGLGLCLGLAGGCSVLQLGARLVQFFLRLAALFFQLGEQFFSISQSLRAGAFQMLEQAARQLLEQVQRSVYRLLGGRHGLPPD